MEIVINGDQIEISRDGVNQKQIIDAEEIEEIGSIYNDFTSAGDPAVKDQQAQYGHNTMTVINLILVTKHIMKIELQEVTNQPTWNLGTLAALNTAVAAFEGIA